MEEAMMTAVPRHPTPVQGGRRLPSQVATTLQKKAGRPKGVPSTIINLRIPMDLLAQLDRYIDHLEVQTGLKANRAMMARRALALFLETRATDAHIDAL
jgi:hypothetical protein